MPKLTTFTRSRTMFTRSRTMFTRPLTTFTRPLTIAPLAALALVAFMDASAQAGRAQHQKWCAMERDNLHDCSYATLEQCVVTISGRGIHCALNPRGWDEEIVPRRRARRH